MEEPPQEERASPFGRRFDEVFGSLIALIGGAIVVTMFTELDWSAPWWLTALTIPLVMGVAAGLAWAILFALAAAADFVIGVRENRG